MRARIARGIAVGLAAFLVLAYIFLPFQQESEFSNNSGRKKEEIPAAGEISWPWTPGMERVNDLRMTLSGVKKAVGMTVIATLRDAQGAEVAVVRQAIDDLGDSEGLTLSGSFTGTQTYTLALSAEGEGSIKVKGEADEEGNFYPLLWEMGRVTRRNPVLLYFALGLLLLALTPVRPQMQDVRANKGRQHPLDRWLPWGTFLLIFGIGLLLSLKKPLIDMGSVWRSWDEEDVHEVIVAAMLPGNAASLQHWLSQWITWYPGYLPLALGGALAGLFTQDAGIIYRACILCSSLVYAALAALAVHHAPRYKVTFLVAGALPTILFQMTSRTYDTVVTGSILLGLALVLESVEKEDRISPLRALTMVALLAFGTVAKPAYSLMLLSLWMIPAQRWGGKKQAWIFRGYVLLVLGWCMAALVMPGAYDSIRGGDERFAGADAAGQIAWMLANPGEGLLRPLLYFWQSRSMLMTMGISHWAYLGNNTEWNDLFLALLLLVAPLCAWGEKRRGTKLLTPGRRVGLLALAFGIELVLVYTQFIVSSPVGGQVQGMQARYFIPLWSVLAVALMAPFEWRKRISAAAGGFLAGAAFLTCAWVNISYALYWLASTGQWG
ncbi:MAG: DUF2142 domain-containing protein [Clostridia bacterium]|nr:DUF2142 domain-containing protein [Clostridia bacterium]